MSLFPELVGRTAEFSECGNYRWTLFMPIREVFAPAIVWILANSSTADGMKDDPTTRNVRRISELRGYSMAIVLNVCAYRTPYPLELVKALDAGVDVVGKENHSKIAGVLLRKGVKQVVYGWGDCLPDRPELVSAIDTVREIVRDCGHQPVCFGTNASGRPRHPLYLSGASDPTPYVHRI